MIWLLALIFAPMIFDETAAANYAAMPRERILNDLA